MTRVECDQPDIEHTVYVVSTPDGSEVLYVGMSNQVENRLYLHWVSYRSRWAHEPHVVDLWPTPNRAAARVLERELIQALQPRDNKNLNPAYRRTRAA